MQEPTRHRKQKQGFPGGSVLDVDGGKGGGYHVWIGVSGEDGRM